MAHLHAVLASSIYSAPPVEAQPEVILTSWRIFQVESSAWEGSSLHLVGFNLETGDGRVSSQATRVGFNETGLLFKTESGRKYELRGEPGWDSDAEYVWNYWKTRNRVTSEKDVTDDFKAVAVVESKPDADPLSGDVAQPL